MLFGHAHHRIVSISEINGAVVMTERATKHARELAAAAEATVVKADDSPSNRGKTLVCIRVDASKLSFIGLNEAMDEILNIVLREPTR